MRRALALLALLVAPALASAQPGSTTRFGLGVKLEPSSVSVPNQNGFQFGASPVISVPIDISGVVRIEPEVGYLSSSQDNNGQEFTARQTVLGVAISALVPANDITLTAGGRVRYLRNSFEFDFGGSNTSESTSSALAIGPVVGGEYPFSRRFAIGGEVGLEYRSFSFDDDNGGSRNDVDASSVSTTAAVTVRFFL